MPSGVVLLPAVRHENGRIYGLMAELYYISALELDHYLQDQAMDTLQTVADNFQHPVFPCALIAGDVVMLHLLKRLNLIGSEADGKVQARTSRALGHTMS